MPEITLPAVREGGALAPVWGLSGALARARAAFTAVRSYAPVEARRNRVLYVGLPLIVLGSLPFSAAIAAAVDIPASQGVAGALAAWAILGLPLMAVLFGAVTGAGLRGTSEEVEGVLPLSPRARAFGALAASGTAFSVNVALVAAIIAARSADTSSLLSGIASLGNWASAGGYVSLMLTIATSSVAWLLSVSFLASYAASHAVLGAVTALFGAGILLLPVGAGMSLFLNHGPHLALPFLLCAAASTAASAGAAALAVGAAAPRVARSSRTSWVRVALLCLLPLSGSLASWPALWSAGRTVKTHLASVWNGWDQKFYDETEEAFTARVRAQDVRDSGLMEGPAGRLVRVTPAGTTVLLPGGDPALGELVRSGRDRFEDVRIAFAEASGRVWVEVRSPHQDGQPRVHTVWTGDGTGELSRYVVLPPGMDLSIYDGRAVIDVEPNSSGAKEGRFVPLDPAKPPVLKRQ